MRGWTFFVLAGAVLAAQVAHQHHPPRSADEYARVLEDPARDEWQKPEEVVKALALGSEESVADIGAGSGYFARRFAKHAAKVFAVDIDAKLLELSAKGAPSNLTTILSTHDDPKLPPASVDTVFICDVLHHIENRASYYPKLATALKPGGRVVIVDFYKKPLPVGPPPSMKLEEEQVIRELTQAGFRLKRKHSFLPYQYFLEFTRV
jgi:2-polyprenyl-3-methyl-5-hydroxy-6-metoxy-1,4-benzoquinol methylase